MLAITQQNSGHSKIYKCQDWNDECIVNAVLILLSFQFLVCKVRRPSVLFHDKEISFIIQMHVRKATGIINKASAILLIFFHNFITLSMYCFQPIVVVVVVVFFFFSFFITYVCTAVSLSSTYIVFLFIICFLPLYLLFYHIRNSSIYLSFDFPNLTTSSSSETFITLFTYSS